MDEFKMPESSARACVNVAKSNSIGLIWYCKEDDSFELDAEAVDEFYDNMDVLLSRNARENKRIKEWKGNFPKLEIRITGKRKPWIDALKFMGRT